MNSYPGLGMPISQYGYNFDGSPSAGPFSMFQGQGQQTNSYGGQGYHGWQPSPYTPDQPAAAPTSGSSTSLSFNPSSTATGFYNDVLSGKQEPMNQTVQDSMLSDASDMTAAAETAQNQQMMNQAAASGASASDPSLRGAQMQNAAARQGGNVKAKQGIDMQANQANFGAKQNAASHLMDYDLQQQGFKNGWMKTALGFMPGSGGGGGGYGSTQSHGSNQGFAGFHADNQDPWGQGQAPAYKPNDASQSYNQPDDYNQVMGAPSRPNNNNANNPAGYR